MTLDKEYQIPFADSIIYPWRRVSDTLVRADETMMDSAAEVTVKDALKAPKIVFMPKQKMLDAANAVYICKWLVGGNWHFVT